MGDNDPVLAFGDSNDLFVRKRSIRVFTNMNECKRIAFLQQGNNRTRDIGIYQEAVVRR